MHRITCLLAIWMLLCTVGSSDDSSTAEMGNSPFARIDGTGPGWVQLGEDDFVRVNGDEKTLTWDGQTATGSGFPIGVTRSVKSYKNFEFVIEWQHQESGGNSGVFAWVPPGELEGLPPGKLPRSGIEIQMLDHGYVEKYEARGGKKPYFFSTNGDVFPVGKSKMKPFPPLSPNGSRSFPSEENTRGFRNWNHYYVRAINGEVRLWINGLEVSGGNQCSPSEGHLCLESEGAPIWFRGLRIRELP